VKNPLEYLPGGPPQHRQAGIMAYFPDEDAAAAAERELRGSGYAARRERISAQLSAEMHLPVATDLTGRLDPPGPVLVAVAVDGDRYDTALAILRRHGGEMAP
jgi:hypothetical protein